jgi:hypothetical protein
MGFYVSEGGLEPPRRGNFPELGKFHVIRIPDRLLVFKYLAELAPACASLGNLKQTALRYSTVVLASGW